MKKNLKSRKIQKVSKLINLLENWNFNPKKEDWESYIERLELYFEAKDVKPEKKLAILLTKVGTEMYKLIRELCAPTKPKDKVYQDIVDLVKNHLNPKRNEPMERCTFQQARQAPNESIANFVARLKELALHCNFSDLNTALRDQLVCGIQDHDSRVALFSEEKLTYDKAVQLATTRETALRNAAHTEKAALTSSESTVKHINTTRRTGNMRKFDNKDVKGSKPNTGNNDYICFCCGRVNDFFVDKCRMKNVTCNSCKGRGHIEKMCFKKHGKSKVISSPSLRIHPPMKILILIFFLFLIASRTLRTVFIT